MREGPCRDPLLVAVSHVALAYRVSGEDVDMDTAKLLVDNLSECEGRGKRPRTALNFGNDFNLDKTSSLIFYT